jgi:predicted GNAT family acetyltransferase
VNADSVQVRDNPPENRYEAALDGRVVGFSEYELQADRIRFLHTEVDPSLEGRGIGSALARAVLDRARAEQWKVVARCPFIAKYVERHPEYQSLIRREL